MEKQTLTTTETKTSRAVHVSVLFVVITATVAALIGAAAIIGRMLQS